MPIRLKVCLLACCIYTSCAQPLPSWETTYTSSTWGEVIYGFIHTAMQAQTPCGDTQAFLLEQHKTLFIAYVDWVLSYTQPNDVSDMVQNHLVPMVQDGDLPMVSQAIGTFLHQASEDAPFVENTNLWLQSAHHVSLNDTLFFLKTLMDEPYALPWIEEVGETLRETTSNASVASVLLEELSDVLGVLFHPMECRGFENMLPEEALLKEENGQNAVSASVELFFDTMQNHADQTMASLLLETQNTEPLKELLFLMWETMKYPESDVFLQSFHQLVSENKHVSMDVLRSLAWFMRTLSQSETIFFKKDIFQLAQKTEPFWKSVLSVQNSSNTTTSTVHVLMQTLLRIHQERPRFLNDLQDTITYQKIRKKDTCEDGTVIEETSVKVDYNRPSFFMKNDVQINNQSSLEQSVHLLASVDCGRVPFTNGKTLAHFILERFSQSSPQNVCGVIDTSLSLLETTSFIGESLTSWTLDAIGCEGDDVLEKLQALDALAQSGALHVYLPVAKVFVEKNQVPLLLELMHMVSEDFSSTSSVLRPLMPVIKDAIQEGVLESFLQVNKLLLTLPSTHGQDSMLDVWINACLSTFDTSKPVKTSRGVVYGKSLFWHTTQQAALVAQEWSSDAAQKAVQKTLDIFSNTLEKEAFYVFLKGFLSVGEHFAQVSYQDKTCMLSEFQSRTTYFIEKNRLERWKEVWNIVLKHPNVLNKQFFSSRTMRTHASRVGNSLLLEYHNAQQLSHMAVFASKAFKQRTQGSEHILDVLADVVSRDTHQVLWNLLKASLQEDHNNPSGAIGAQLAQWVLQPLLLGETNMCGASEEILTAESLSEMLKKMAFFLKEDPAGVQALYRLIATVHVGMP
jgi:hypothetical protein